MKCYPRRVAHVSQRTTLDDNARIVSIVLTVSIPNDVVPSKILVAIPRFLLRKKKEKREKKKKTPSIDSPCFGLSYGAFAIVFSSLGNLNFVMIELPRFSKSSGIDPKKALL